MNLALPVLGPICGHRRDYTAAFSTAQSGLAGLFGGQGEDFLVDSGKIGRAAEAHGVAGFFDAVVLFGEQLVSLATALSVNQFDRRTAKVSPKYVVEVPRRHAEFLGNPSPRQVRCGELIAHETQDLPGALRLARGLAAFAPLIGTEHHDVGGEKPQSLLSPAAGGCEGAGKFAKELRKAPKTAVVERSQDGGGLG